MEPLGQVKLCKDCKHFTPVRLGQYYPMCNHPNAPVDLVWGNKNGTCKLMRSLNCTIPHCGVEGAWYEPK
jgi:hypothetical protein